MRILALDLGTQCGYARAAGPGAPIDSGEMDLRPKRYEGGGMRYLRFRSHLHVLLVDVQLVLYEEVRRHLGTDAAHIYGGLLAHLQFECEAMQIPYQGVPVQTIKKHATGKGNADKIAMVMAAQQRWPEKTLSGNNEADALWLLSYGLAEWGEQSPALEVR